MKRLIERMKQKFRKKEEQLTFCFCPNCRHELVGDPSSFIEDTDLVRYKCSACGNKSEWNFDIAPVALVVRSDNGYTDINPSGYT